MAVSMKLLGIRLFWMGLAVLAAYVLFIMFVADVGGDEPAIPQPTPPSSTAEVTTDLLLPA